MTEDAGMNEGEIAGKFGSFPLAMDAVAAAEAEAEVEAAVDALARALCIRANSSGSSSEREYSDLNSSTNVVNSWPTGLRWFDRITRKSAASSFTFARS